MALDKGVKGMQEAFDYINLHNKEENALDITTKLYSNSAYYFRNLELEIKVHYKDTTRYFHIEFENPNPLDDAKTSWQEYPILAKAPEDSSHDLFEIFMNIDEEITPELKDNVLYLFDYICVKESKHYKVMRAKDNNQKFIAKLEDPKEIEANTEGILPFDYVGRYNDLNSFLEKQTVYPPEELTTAEDVVKRIREIHSENIVIIDIDYNLDGTYVIVQAENNKSFMASVDLIPAEEDLDEDEISIASFYLLAMFEAATRDITAYDKLTALERRQCIRMILDFQGSTEEVTSSKSTTTTTVNTLPATTSFRPAIYDGVSKGTNTKDNSNKKPKGGRNRGKTKPKDNATSALEKLSPNFDYPRSLDEFDDVYPYE